MAKPKKTGLRAIRNVIASLRAIDPEMPAQQVAVLLEVALSPGISQREIATRLSISQSAVSRNVNALGERHRKGGDGLELLETGPFQGTARGMGPAPTGYHLTARARHVLGQLEEVSR
ncbi:MAG: helix-turn-helix domain-containing protein [Pseudomonadota bacterium]